MNEGRIDGNVDHSVNITREKCKEVINTGSKENTTVARKQGQKNKNCKILHKSVASNRGKCSQKYVLIENQDKYDLELRFIPRHTLKIIAAQSCATFKRWDEETADKYGFIPLGDLLVADQNENTNTIPDIVTLHEKVKELNKHNFMGKQIQVN